MAVASRCKPGRMRGALCALALALWPVWAGAACRQALVLGLDISGSVDEREYRLQMDGLAAALMNREVQAAFFAIPDLPVRLSVFEWAGLGSQRELVRWTDIRRAGDLADIAARLKSTRQSPREVQTAIGQAMLYGGQSLAGQTDCRRRTLDLSGDGESNIGPAPRDVHAHPALAGVTVNALVIGADAARYLNYTQSEIKQLTAYFETEVIRGADAFVEAAIGFEDFQKAMTRKLLKELETLAVSSLMPPDQRPRQ
ncbi:MAG: DUF1194 domain-containing protein [Paracoccaceae bacterium]